MLQMEMRLKSAEVKHNEDKLQLHKRHEMAMKQVQFEVSCYSTVTQPVVIRYWIARTKSWRTQELIIVYNFRGLRL